MEDGRKWWIGEDLEGDGRGLFRVCFHHGIYLGRLRKKSKNVKRVGQSSHSRNASHMHVECKSCWRVALQ